MQQVIYGTSATFKRFPVEPEYRVDGKCLCLNTDFSDPESAGVHIAGCIMGQVVTDENLPKIIRALEIYKKESH